MPISLQCPNEETVLREESELVGINLRLLLLAPRRFGWLALRDECITPSIGRHLARSVQ